MKDGMSIWQADETGGTAVESRYSITLVINEILYEELIGIVSEDRLEEVIMYGIEHAIRREKCRQALENHIDLKNQK